ncbi:MAG: transporter [Marinilabiliaceae bacterium]
MRPFSITTFFIVLFSVSNSKAQDNHPLVTDRPDMTESSVSVAPGFFQIETGFHFENEQTDGTNTYYRNLNTSLLRYGLLDGLEFRFGFGYSSFSAPGSTLTGFEPSSFGFKFELFEQSGMLPETAFLNTFVPGFSGSREFRPAQWESEFLGAMAWGIEEFDLGVNLGVAFGEADGALFPYSWALGVPVLNNLDGFVELFGSFSENGGSSHSGNIGLTWLLNPDFQLDAYYGLGFNDRAVDWSAGIGLSWRFEI